VKKIFVGKEILFPVSSFDSIKDKNLRRLIMMGMRFVVFDIKTKYIKGERAPALDMVEIMSTIDDHGSWVFERHTLEDLVFRK